MAKKEFFLGERVYVLIGKEIKEAYIIGFSMTLFRILSHLKLPKLRIFTNLFLDNIKRAIEEPNIKVYNFINIKPIFLLLMKKYFDVSLKDIAAFFSAKAKVLISSKSGIAEEKTVLISRIYKTRIEAMLRNSETGKYCYICGTEYRRMDDIPLKATTPCKKCQDNIRAIGEQIEGLLPFNVRNLTPKIPKGFLMRGFIMDGKIFYPYKSEETLKEYLKLQDNPDWKLEDVKLSYDPETNRPVIDGAYFRTRKLLSLKSVYNKKDFRKRTHIKVLENYLKYIETGKYNKPVLKDNNLEYPEEEDGKQIILGNSSLPSKLSLTLNIGSNNTHNIPFESNTSHSSYTSYENSLFTIDKAQNNFVTLDLITNSNFKIPSNGFITDIWIYTSILGKQELLLSIRNLDDQDNKIDNQSLERFSFIDITKLPIGVFGFTIIYFVSHRTKENNIIFYKDFVYKRHINIIDSNVDNYSLPSNFECSDENFLKKINNKIFNSLVPLNKIKFNFLGNDDEKAKIILSINNRIFKELIFDKTTFIPPELPDPNESVVEYENETMPKEIFWNEKFLENITMETFNMLGISDPFDINKLRFEFYNDDNVLFNIQEIFFRFVNNPSLYSDNLELFASTLNPNHIYNNLETYSFNTYITILNKRRSFYLKFIIIDLYNTPYSNTSTVKYRQVIDISSYAYDWGNMPFSYLISKQIELLVWNQDYTEGRIEPGEYFLKMSAIIQYPENFQEELSIDNFKDGIAIEDISSELLKYYSFPIKFRNLPTNEVTDGTTILVDSDDAYANAEKEGFSIVNMVFDKEHFKFMCEKLAYKIGSIDSEKYFTEFVNTLPDLVREIKNPFILQPRILKSIDEPEFSKIKLYDKNNIIRPLRDLPEEVDQFGDSAILQFVYTNQRPNLEKPIETGYESVFFKDELEKYHLANDLKDFITSTEEFSYISFQLENYSFFDTLGDPGSHYLFNKFMGRNLAKTDYKLGDKVFFLQSVGGEESPVKLIYNGIIEEIYFNIPKNIKFNEVEYYLFKELNNVRADIIGSTIPMMGKNNPPELPIDIQRQYKIRGDSLYSSYEDAKKDTLWVFCLYCQKFKKPLPKDKTLKDLLEFTEYILTGEVDNPQSEIPSKLNDTKNLKKFSEDVIRQSTFNTKLLDTYRNIDKNNLVLALKVKSEGSYHPTSKDEVDNLIMSEDEYLQSYDKNLFKSDYNLKKDNERRDNFLNVDYGKSGSELENIVLDDRDTLQDQSSPIITNIFPDTADRTRYLMNQMGMSLNEYSQKLIGGITQFDSLQRKIDHARNINNEKLDELRSKLNFGIVNLGDVIESELASHITICAECQAKIKNQVMDLLKKISNFLSGFPADSEKEIKFYTIDYIDVEFYRETKDYSKYNLVLPLTLEGKEAKILKDEIKKQLIKLEKK